MKTKKMQMYSSEVIVACQESKTDKMSDLAIN